MPKHDQEEYGGLEALGFDASWRETARQHSSDDLRPARVTAVDRERYLVRNESDEIRAEVTGKLLYAAASGLDLPVVGDWVLVRYYDDDSLAIIHEVLPRRSILRRKSAGSGVEYQAIAANIDAAFVVQGSDRDFNPNRLDRYLVMITDGRIEPVLMLSKIDLIDAETLDGYIRSVRDRGYSGRLVAASSRTGDGWADVEELFKPSRTYCLLGSSGVGKTTLMNRLLGHDGYLTSETRQKDGRGRHTTTRRQLIVLPGGSMVVDNPGMRELSVIEAGEGLDETFSEIAVLSEECRFRDCSHTHETECAVLAAVAGGDLSESRYQNYLKITRESAFHERSYVERRRKDRELGKFYKSVLQSKKDRR